MVQNKTEIAIVGSGLCSSLLAKQLRDVAHVTVFERGAASPQPPQRHAETGRPLGLFPSYGYGLGGTTNYWVGGLVRLRPGECEGKWPSRVVEALPRYEKNVITALYGEDAAEGFFQYVPATVNGNLFKDIILRPPEPFRAAKSGYFDGVRLKLRNEVLSVRESNGTVIVRSKHGDIYEEHRFDQVILAAGNIGSTLILARSELGGPIVGRNVTDHPMGYVAKLTAHGKNRFDELATVRRGRFAYDPMLKVRDPETGLWTSIYLRPTATARIYSDPYMESFDVLARRAKFGKYMESFDVLARRIKFQKYRAALSNLGDPDFRAQALAFALGRATDGEHVYVLVLAEQEPTGQGGVSEKDGVVNLDWKVSDQVIASIKRSVAQVAEWTGSVIVTEPGGDLVNRLWSGAHHSGGCRISEDPAHGVVDASLRVHGTNEIYVCDGSVLPSSGSSNTGLTIGCLAYRLGEQLSTTKAKAAAPKRKIETANILVTGASGNVGTLLVPELERAGVDYATISLREDKSSRSKKSKTVNLDRILIHLAYDGNSTEINDGIQKRAGFLAENLLIDKTIVPMSFATLQTGTAQVGDPNSFNFGFEAPYVDTYVEGKLKSEEFWTAWQSQKPGRQVIFLYVPTICGPHNLWTRYIAGHWFGSPMWVPTIRRFFSVTEERLAQAFLDLCKPDTGAGVSRYVIFDRSDSLAKTIAWERGTDDVHEVPMPYLLTQVNRSRFVRKGAMLGQKVLNKAISLTINHQIVPFNPLFFCLFQIQDRFASNIERAAKAAPLPSGSPGWNPINEDVVGGTAQASPHGRG